MNAPRSGTRHEATRYARDPVAGVKSLLGSSEEGCLEIDVTIGHMGVTSMADLAAAHATLLRRRGFRDLPGIERTFTSRGTQTPRGRPFGTGDGAGLPGEPARAEQGITAGSGSLGEATSSG